MGPLNVFRVRNLRGQREWTASAAHLLQLTGAIIINTIDLLFYHPDAYPINPAKSPARKLMAFTLRNARRDSASKGSMPCPS